MNTIIEKIRAWVEREKEKQIDIWRDSTSEDALGMALDKISVYNQFLSVLSDLEKEEKPTLQEQPVKTDIVEDLQHYLATTPKEQIKKDWESLKEWDKVGPSVSEFLGWKQPVCEGFDREFSKFSNDVDAEHPFPICADEFKDFARHFYELGCRRTAEKYDEIEYKRQRAEVCEGLEEAVVDYFEGYWPGMETAEQCNTDLHFTPPAIMRLARHFAQWQMEQMKRFVEENIGRVSILFADAVARDAIDHEFRKCDFKNGAEWVIGKVTIEEVTK